MDKLLIGQHRRRRRRKGETTTATARFYVLEFSSKKSEKESLESTTTCWGAQAIRMLCNVRKMRFYWVMLFSCILLLSLLYAATVYSGSTHRGHITWLDWIFKVYVQFYYAFSSSKQSFFSLRCGWLLILVDTLDLFPLRMIPCCIVFFYLYYFWMLETRKWWYE